MKLNYFKSAWRNLNKNRSFSVINIAGLAIGMAGAILIGLWLHNMLSMDRFHEKGDRLHIISNRDVISGEKIAWVSTPRILAPTLQADYPEIEAYSRYENYQTFLTQYKDQKIMANFAFVDPGFLNMFNFKLLQGQKTDLLKTSKSVVLTETFAKTLFGDQDPIGQTIQLEAKNLVTVEAVMQDPPNNSSIQFDYLLSFEYAKALSYYDEQWGNNSINTFVLLKPHVSLATFNDKIKGVIRQHGGSDGLTADIFALPFQDYYLYNNGQGGDYKTGRIRLVYLFACIGIFILVVACINFMNLSTARAAHRSKEVGVRKVIGASRANLIMQFLSESILIALLAMLIAILIVSLCLPQFNLLVEKQLVFSLSSAPTLLYTLTFSILVGILAGCYPAFLLSGFKPVKTLKGINKSGKKGLSLRSALVVLQFSLSIILIIATLIVNKQIQYTKDRDKGYDEQNLLYTSMVGDTHEKYTTIRHELLESRAVLSVSKNLSPITNRYSDSWGFSWANSSEEDQRISFIRYSSDANAIENFGLKLLVGRDIDVYKFPTDSSAVVLTESALKIMQLDDPIGKIVKGDGRDWQIVGVVADFIIESPFSTVKPMLIFGPNAWFNSIHYRLNPEFTTEQNLKTIAKVFEKHNPDYPFEYIFADTDYKNKFKETQAVGTMSTFFAGLTIFVSCLGLLGLVTYMIETRTKEIAVRKVLGASITQITTMLSKSFLGLVLLALLIATPLAWWITTTWLADFSYRIAVEWTYFSWAALLVVLICGLTISLQTIRAARTNPVDSLRDE